VVLEGKSTAFTEGVLDLIAAGAQALAPAIWPFEVANALLVAERRKRITGTGDGPARSHSAASCLGRKR